MNVRVSQPGKLLASPIQLAILALLAGNAVAAAPADAPSAPPAATAEANSATIQEVYVTATKRTTSLQKTPVAVTALNAAALDDNHVQTI